MKQLKLYQLLAVTVVIIIIAVAGRVSAQSVDAKLAGSSVSEYFQVTDNSNNVLFKVFGNNRITMGTGTAGMAQVLIAGQGTQVPLEVTCSTVNSGIQIENTGSGIGMKSTCSPGVGVFGIGKIGVRGESADANGDGVFGKTNQPGARGVYGYNSATTGNAYGVVGESASSTGIGVYGIGGIGVMGETYNGNAYGVYGRNASSAASSYGVRGEAASGSGVSGLGHYGVLGVSNDASGVGVYGQCDGSWGGFFMGKGYFKDNVGIGTTNPQYKLQVNGTAAKTGGGSWTNASDIRLKNIEGSYTRGLNDIVQLRPIRFHYKPDNPKSLPSEPVQIGFVAQEVQKVFPEAVSTGDDGYLDLNLHAVNVALVNAVKELREMVRLQGEKIQSLERQVAAQHTGTQHLGGAPSNEN